MKGYVKWGGLPEILLRSFQLLSWGCTVVIATETRGISRGGTSQWEIMGCCWQDNTFSSFRIFFLCQDKLGHVSSWAADTAITTTRQSDVTTIPTSTWCKSSTRTEEFSLHQKEFPWVKKTFEYHSAGLPGSQKSVSCPCWTPQKQLNALVTPFFSVWLQLFLHHFSLFLLLPFGNCSRAAPNCSANGQSNIRQWTHGKFL